jgi:Mg/Co/Ni transporter MgtE
VDVPLRRAAQAPDGIDDDCHEDNEPGSSSLHKFWHRAGWLVLLLMCQSTSSVILEHFEALIRSHPVVIYFLTMLVGAGGNAGSQSTVLVVRQLAISAARGERQTDDRWLSVQRILGTEVSVGARLAIVLFAASFVRCIVFQVRGMECLAICLSMLAIVFTSTLVGAALPLVLNRLGIDPAHAGAAIQVIMDISGVTLTCIISCTVLGVQVGKPQAPGIIAPTGSPGTEQATTANGARLPGIQREGIYKLNSFGSFVKPDGI